MSVSQFNQFKMICISLTMTKQDFYYNSQLDENKYKSIRMTFSQLYDNLK